VLYVTGVYITGVLFLWLPVAVLAMWVVVSAPEVCCLGHNVVSLWGRTYKVLMINDPYKMYINTLRPGKIPKPFVAAKESHSIRSVMMNVNSRNPIKCVIDPSSSIIAMSEEVCHELGLAYDPSVHIPLQSANSGIE
jgi:hypothetical protein